MQMPFAMLGFWLGKRVPVPSASGDGDVVLQTPAALLRGIPCVCHSGQCPLLNRGRSGDCA